ncbi:alpha/beta hydrolase family protein [Streptomyces liangshanensis]|uniref:alpha/beta hydrolase family protein n=1 Tax=Streptomyces liangshanensis TaxID=2717324 RepID=UPI0036DF3336
MANSEQTTAPHPAATPPGRRRVLTAGAALGLVAALAPVASASASASATTAAPPEPPAPTVPPPPPGPAPKLVLPRPTGPHPIGTTSVRLVDAGRRDPWLGGPVRELMVQFWYPTRPAGRGRTARGHHPLAPWMDREAAKVHQRSTWMYEGYVVLADTHARLGAPADTSAGPRPVILHSPGAGMYRAASTSLVEDLASHGYVVVTIDHTYDAAQVEFPGGRVETYAVGDIEANVLKAVEVRVADTRFVLEELSRIARSRTPGGGHRLPHGLAGPGGVLDLGRTAMFGHSLGGATAISALGAGAPFRAVVNLDGTVFGPVVGTGVDRPVLLMGADEPEDTSWQEIRPRLRSWCRTVQIRGTAHRSFTDEQTFLPQAAERIGATTEQLDLAIGPLARRGQRGVDIQRDHLRAYFDHFVRGRPRPGFLDRPSRTYPEVRFLR